MPVRVSPTDRIHRHIDDLFAADRPLPEILEEVARLGAQLLMQAALEAEVTGSWAGTVTPVPRSPKMPVRVRGTGTGT